MVHRQHNHNHNHTLPSPSSCYQRTLCSVRSIRSIRGTGLAGLLLLVLVLVLLVGSVLANPHDASGILLAQDSTTPTPTPTPSSARSPVPPPGLYAPSVPVVSASFDVLSSTQDVSITLGSVAQVSVAITNTTDSALTPVLYEAWPAPPPGTAPLISDTRSLQHNIALAAQVYPRVDEQIMTELAATPDTPITFLVVLSEQADLSHAYTIADWGERGWFVYRTLTEHARTSQHDIRDWLDAHDLTYQPLWILNAVVVDGDEDDVAALAAREEVAFLRANHTMSIDNEPVLSDVNGCQADASNSHICWNIHQIGADLVWHDFGVSGSGITVSSIDSGVRYTHPALIEQYRGHRSGGTFNHNYNWYDPISSSTAPEDAGSHGTHTMGTIVAASDGTADQPAVGVAPGASWITARGCGERLCSEVDLLKSAEWLLAPTDMGGKNPRPDLRPHIINNSWASNESEQTQYVQNIESVRAAGIFPVFVSGNAQTSLQCGNVVSPGDFSNVVAVGATDREDWIASFSRLGPTWDGRLKPDLTAPGFRVASTSSGSGLSYAVLDGTSMAAPHVVGTVALLWSANPTLIGDYDATYRILTESAVPRTDPYFDDDAFEDCHANTVPNNVYGYGRVDAYAAVASTKIDVPWLELPDSVPSIRAGDTVSLTFTFDARAVSKEGVYTARALVSSGDLSQTPTSIVFHLNVHAPETSATVSGNVLSENTNQPLNAKVTRDIGETGEDGPQVEVDVDEQGYFEMTLPLPAEPYTVTLTATAGGYVPQQVDVPLRYGAHATIPFSLTADNARISADTDPLTLTLAYGDIVSHDFSIKNVGQQPLEYEAYIPYEMFGVWNNDDSGGPALSWVSLPMNSTSVELADDATSSPVNLGFAFPLATEVYTNVQIGANGVLVFGEVKQTGGFVPWCPPVAETEQAAIFPFRADLDPAQGGEVSYARFNDGFLITYDNVPLHDKAGTSFTFQVLLKPDGRIIFNYKDLDTLPTYVSAGVQDSSIDVQTIGCGQDTPISSGLTLELRPQPASSEWLELDVTDGDVTGVLPVGETQEFRVFLRWASDTDEPPYRSALAIASNDVDKPTLRLPVEVTMEPPPARLWLPLLMR